MSVVFLEGLSIEHLVACMTVEMLRVEAVAERNYALTAYGLPAFAADRSPALVIVDLAKWGTIEFEVGATDERAVTVLEGSKLMEILAERREVDV